MSALLGLPARTGGGGGGSGGGGGESGDPISYADRLSAADKLKVDALLKASNSSDDPRRLVRRQRSAWRLRRHRRRLELSAGSRPATASGRGTRARAPRRPRRRRAGLGADARAGWQRENDPGRSGGFLPATRGDAPPRSRVNGCTRGRLAKIPIADWWTQNAPPPAAALGGPSPARAIRCLSNPDGYADRSEVLEWDHGGTAHAEPTRDAGYRAGTALNATVPGAQWDPIAGQKIATGHDDDGPAAARDATNGAVGLPRSGFGARAARLSQRSQRAAIPADGGVHAAAVDRRRFRQPVRGGSDGVARLPGAPRSV